ncbi:uncharacterized protein [Ptychodera flava]|uniref:uncharacterized protein isoform X2 n=2 Tax=Ptychodera flava TaxID=63121 RepID=UPI00396A5093
MGCGSSGHRRTSRNSIKINVIEPTSIAPEPSDIEPYSVRRESYNGVQTIEEEDSSKMASSTSHNKNTHDAMISFHQADTEFVKYLSGELKKNNIRVWRDDPTVNPVDAVSHKGQAIVESKVFLIVLSKDSASSKTCQDEVALAYISNKAIFPVAREQFALLSQYLDFGMRLTLAKLNWIFFEKQSDRQENFPQLLAAMKQEIEDLDAHQNESASDLAETDNEPPKFRMNYQRQKSRRNLLVDLRGSRDFWERTFGNTTEVAWIEFREKFIAEYEDRLATEFPEDKTRWLMNLIYKDVLELSKTIQKKTYDSFCGDKQGDPDSFYERLKDYAVGSFAIREVFDMESTVRLDAIQNLSTFRTPSVITALLDLLDDQDPNMRAVAAISLGRTGKTNRKIVDRLIKLLGDEDRLVRESACLSLGHLQVESAVPNIVDLWRNDAISHVRNAAELALSLMGAEKAKEAVKVTKVLSDEMKSLATDK